MDIATPRLPALPLRKDQWARLKRLRKGFLERAQGGYWRDEEDVRLYDEVFAQRIEWKWEGAMRQIEATGWTPCSSVLVDWGCGSGRISRLLAAKFPFERIHLHDQSPTACQFALAAHKLAQLPTTCSLPEPGENDGFLLVVSHVLGELPQSALGQLLELARRASEILWVESGDRATSLNLSAVREKLCADGFQMVAPCTHQQPCPVLHSGADPHWCHFFAKPPSWIFQSAFWREVGERLEIDLRSLPFSFLAATKAGGTFDNSLESATGANRVIGIPTMRKGFAEVLACGNGELRTIRINKRDDKEKFGGLKKQRESFLL